MYFTVNYQFWPGRLHARQEPLPLRRLTYDHRQCSKNQFYSRNAPLVADILDRLHLGLLDQTFSIEPPSYSETHVICFIYFIGKIRANNEI